jgi:hypothetical protein
VPVDAWVGLRVLAVDDLAGAGAEPEQARRGAQAQAEVRLGRPGNGPVDHLGTLAQLEHGRIGAGQPARALDHLLHDRVEVERRRRDGLLRRDHRREQRDVVELGGLHARVIGLARAA